MEVGDVDDELVVHEGGGGEGDGDGRRPPCEAPRREKRYVAVGGFTFRVGDDGQFLLKVLGHVHLVDLGHFLQDLLGLRDLLLRQQPPGGFREDGPAQEDEGERHD